MKFYKYHGTGNDFIIVKEAVTPNFIKSICNRHFGIGADGLIYYEKIRQGVVRMHYFNADGTEALMCGNGVRSLVKYLHDTKIDLSKNLIIETKAGIISTYIEDLITVEVPLPTLSLDHHQTAGLTEWYCRPFSYEHGEVEVSVVAALTLHAVVLETVQDKTVFGNSMQQSKYFLDSLNVNFVQVLSPKEVSVETYERGVGWTYSCGTGVIASTWLLHHLGKINDTVTVIVRGGKLIVTINDKIYLKGPAEKIAEGDFVWST